MSKKRRWGLLLVIVLLAAVLVGLLSWSRDRLEGYIRNSGETSMSAVVEQLQQGYDLQVKGYYDDLKFAEDYLFTASDRSIALGENLSFIEAMQKKSGAELLFIKSNGTSVGIDGKKARLEIQSQLLLDLEQGKNIAKVVSRASGGSQEDCYLIAVPVDPYSVDGETYNAIGALYERSAIDSILSMSAYEGRASLFLVDEAGEVTYANLDDEGILRNYALVKHLEREGALTEGQAKTLADRIAKGKQGVQFLGESGKKFYLGYAPLSSSNSTLVCIVPRTAVDGTLLGYQRTVMRSTVFSVFVVFVLACALMLTAYRARLERERGEFEAQKRRMQDEAYRALEVEKTRADAASRSKSDFLANMSHDIRTPMNAIVGISKLMEHDRDNPEKIEAYLHKLQNSSEHLLSLINDVLDMSKIESNEVSLSHQPVSLAEEVAQVDSIIRPEAEERAQSFGIHVHKIQHEHVLGDPVRLRQVLINLLSNAVKYTPAGGKVRMDLWELSEGAPEGSALYRIEVADNGIGMEPAFIEHIFEPFTRGQNSTVNTVQGTGLGLAIAKNAIGLMGGTIEVESEPGRGSRFTVKVALEIDRDAQESLAVQSVLLVASDEELIENARAGMSAAGAELFVASSKAEIGALLLGTKIDAILLASHACDEDIVQTVRALHTKAPDAVIIYVVEQDRRGTTPPLAKKLGVDGFISRPFFLSTFAHAVDRARGAESKPGSEMHAILQGKRFLCAEDNTMNAEILSAVLEMNGASCTVYPNGEALVQAFESVKPGDYDAILMDIQMPVMNGLDATRAIRTGKNPLGREIRIIAMTANAFSSDVQACLDAGMDAHVAKPLYIDALERALA